MFSLKISILGIVFLITIVQLVSTGINFLDAKGKRKTDFAPTSFVEASVVEVVLPTPAEAEPRRVPPYEGTVVVEYRDSSGSVLRKEFGRMNSMGPTNVYDKKVGDTFKIEIPDPEKGTASTNEKVFWRNMSKLLLIFAGVLFVAALVFKF